MGQRLEGGVDGGEAPWLRFVRGARQIAADRVRAEDRFSLGIEIIGDSLDDEDGNHCDGDADAAADEVRWIARRIDAAGEAEEAGAAEDEGFALEGADEGTTNGAGPMPHGNLPPWPGFSVLERQMNQAFIAMRMRSGFMKHGIIGPISANGRKAGMNERADWWADGSRRRDNAGGWKGRSGDGALQNRGACTGIFIPRGSSQCLSI